MNAFCQHKSTKYSSSDSVNLSNDYPAAINVLLENKACDASGIRPANNMPAVISTYIECSAAHYSNSAAYDGISILSIGDAQQCNPRISSVFESDKVHFTSSTVDARSTEQLPTNTTFLPTCIVEVTTPAIMVKALDSQSNLLPASASRQSSSLEDRRCTYCGKQFQYMKDLKRHLPKHTGLKPYNCQECEKSFGRRDKLQTHIKTHCNARRRCRDTGKAIREREANSAASDSMYDANGRVIVDVFAPVTKIETTSTESRPRMCSYCGKQFTRESNLAAHIRTHTGERPYVCFYCSQAFTRSERLKLHLRTHTGEKPYECARCMRLFSRLHNLNRHARTHVSKEQRETLKGSAGQSGEKTYRCVECGKLFCDAARLRRHLPVHSDVKPHVCSLCGSLFTHLSNMKAHQRTHTGEKPFMCRYCPKSFAKSSGRKRHELNIHQRLAFSQDADAVSQVPGTLQ